MSTFFKIFAPIRNPMFGHECEVSLGFDHVHFSHSFEHLYPSDLNEIDIIR